MFPSPLWKFGLTFKEFLIILILLIVISKNLIQIKFPFYWIDLLGSLFLGYNIFYLFLNQYDLPISLRLTTFRAVILPVLLYFVGRYTLLNDHKISKLFKIIIIMGVISASFGLVEILVPIKYIWNGILDLGGYLTNIKGFARELPQNVPLNFWGYLGRRLAGLSASPLAQGYFLEFIFFLIISGWIYKFHKKSILIILILIAELLTITRASILSMLLVLPLFFLLQPAKVYLKKVIFIYLIILILLLPFLSKVIDLGEKTLYLGEGSSIRHAKAIEFSISNLEKVMFSGQGFGTAGGWVTSLGGEVLGAWENAYTVIAFQIGVPGLILFLGWWFLMTLKILNSWLKESAPFKKMIFLAVSLGNIAYFLTGFVSEQILTFSSVAHFWIFSGIAVNLAFQKNDEVALEKGYHAE